MTSLSRKKRPTTASGNRVTTVKDSQRAREVARRRTGVVPLFPASSPIHLACLVAACSLVLFGGVLTADTDGWAPAGRATAPAVKPAVALSAPTSTEPVEQVGYTTTRTSTQLRWLPVRPQTTGEAQSSTPVADSKETAVSEGATPAQFVIPNAPADAKPLADPFAEGPALMTEAASASQPSPAGEPGVPEMIPTPEPLPLPGDELDRQAAEEGDDFGPLEEELALGPPPVEDECPSPDNIRPITEITNDITAKGTKFPTECSLQGGTFQPRAWAPITFTWKASGVCHKPLYFEQVAVERYGHNLGPIAQPFASGAHFFLTFPILPYKMGLTPPNECMYPLGYYRPGNCAPWILDPIPLSVRAGLWEAGAWTGAAFAIP